MAYRKTQYQSQNRPATGLQSLLDNRDTPRQRRQSLQGDLHLRTTCHYRVRGQR